MTELFSAERLSLARQRRGLNKTKLAALIGVRAPTIAAWERSDREPDADSVALLARALRFPPSFFFAEMDDAVPLDATSFRSLSRMTASQRDAALASGTLMLHVNAWVEQHYNLPNPDLPDLDPGIIDPQSAAAFVRGHWSLGALPVANVLHTLEAHGVRVYALAAQCREVDAFSFWHEPTSTPFIVVGTHKTPERQVFDLAHELGHLVLHRDHGRPRGRDAERQADSFASSFLMPNEDLFLAAPRNPTIEDLATAKHRWKVSVAALAYRMHQLHLITDWHYHNLCVRLSTMGRDKELNSLPREQSQVLTKVLTAMRDDGLSRASIARDLHLHVQDVDTLFDGLVLTGIAGSGEAPKSGEPPTLRLV